MQIARPKEAVPAGPTKRGDSGSEEGQGTAIPDDLLPDLPHSNSGFSGTAPEGHHLVPITSFRSRLDLG